MRVRNQAVSGFVEAVDFYPPGGATAKRKGGIAPPSKFHFSRS